MNLIIKGLRNAVLTGWVLSFMFLLVQGEFNVLISHLVFASVLGGIGCMIALVIYGLPMHYVLNRCGFNKLMHYILVGITPAILFSFIPAFTDVTGRLMVDSIITYVILGATLAIVFWYSVVFRKPNKNS